MWQRRQPLRLSKPEDIIAAGTFSSSLATLRKTHEQLLRRRNRPLAGSNGVVPRYALPILTPGHTPLEWRYDLNPTTNPFLLERMLR